MPLLEAQDITYYYPESERPALRNVSLRIEEGEFLLITGGSGSGKSSLARVLAGLIPAFYGGKFRGRVLLAGREITAVDRRTLGTQVGIVFQDPEKQLVMQTVEAEIAFGLENLGLPLEEMMRRVAEVMGFLGLSSLKNRFTADLSGGEKQKVTIASVLAMRPRVLVLDEPTSQLDPTAAEEILHLVARLHQEMGLTVILIEQRVERCFHLADRLVVMEEGKIANDGPVSKVAHWQVANGLPFLPPVTRFFAAMRFSSVPVTVGEGRRLLRAYLAQRFLARPCRQSRRPEKIPGRSILELEKVWFTYPNGKEALRGVSCAIREGEFVAVMGPNAAGKSTLLKVMAGVLPAGRGKVQVLGRDLRHIPLRELVGQVGYLTQNPDDCLWHATVEEEVNFTPRNLGCEDDDWVDTILQRLGLTDYRMVNPRDLSTGERQRVALAAVLTAKPKLLLLDEPTRGIDCRLKRELGQLLKELVDAGITVVVVTHDVEFVAEYAGRVLGLFGGQIVSDGPTRAVLGRSMFYAPQMSRLFHGFTEEIVLTVNEALNLMWLHGEALDNVQG